MPDLTDPEFRTANFTELGTEDCKRMCSVEKNSCSTSLLCPAGLFCNFVEGDSGYCNTCPSVMSALDSEPYVNMTTLADQSYWTSCNRFCHRASKFDVQGVNERQIEVYSFLYSPLGNATGPLVDCGLGETTCEGAKNSICLIRRGLVYFAHKINSCKSGGGLAAIIYNTESECEIYKKGDTSFEDLIPSLSISYLDGKYLVENSLGSDTSVSVLPAIIDDKCRIGCNKNKPCQGEYRKCNLDWGEHGSCDECIPSDANNFCVEYCSQTQPCTGKGLFCDFNLYDKSSILEDGHSEKRGKCQQCPPEKEGNCLYLGLTDLGVERCTKVCGGSSSLTFSDCKFCPADVAVAEINQLGDSENNACQFCDGKKNSCSENKRDRWDMKFPDRVMDMFGGMKCWAVADMFNTLTNFDTNSATCQLGRMYNYICGCEGDGYAGANTNRKRVMLAWLPRISGILSFLGSLLTIIDLLNDKKRRTMLIYQLTIVLSTFDIFGSIGYSLTSLPLPRGEHMYQSAGNSASCNVQGFLIQLGTTSAYVNVSLAIVYSLMIKYSWIKERFSSIKLWLFICPMTIGIGLAFAGLPSYTSVILWCNNGAPYWPEIPVAVAIITITVVMLDLCVYVYQVERKTDRWRGTSNVTGTISKSEKVFWKSFYYLMGFYLTWIPYLVLQFRLSNKKAYTNYGLFLIAGILVPLQGFWNFLAHIRTKMKMDEDFKMTSVFGSKTFSFLKSRNSQSSNIVSSRVSESKKNSQSSNIVSSCVVESKT